MAHITVTAGSTYKQHLRSDFLKRDSNNASCQNMDRVGIGQNPNNQSGDDPENLSGPKKCVQKYKKCLYLGCIAFVVVLVLVLIVLAASGALNTGSS